MKRLPVTLIFILLTLTVAQLSWAAKPRHCELISPDFRQELTAGNLLDPQAVAADPADGQVFFVQHSSYDDREGYDLATADGRHNLWAQHGDSEGVYEVKGGRPVFRFNGAGDPWGTIQCTMLAASAKQELFVHAVTYIDESLNVYDVQSGETKATSTSPYDLRDSDVMRVSRLRGMAARSGDNRLYLADWVENKLDVLDMTRHVFDPWLKLDFAPDGLYADSAGSLYVAGVNGFDWNDKPYLLKVKADKTTEWYALPSVPRLTGLTSFYFEHASFNPISGGFAMAGWSTKGERTFDCVVEAYPATGKAVLVAKAIGEDVEIGGLAVDKYGAITITCGASSGANFAKGELIRLFRRWR